MLPVTIWMNMPSFYQDDLFAELARKVDLRVVYDRGLTNDRRQLGWPEPIGEYSTRILEPTRKISHAIKIARSETTRVHVINGIWAEPAFTTAALVLGKSGARFAIYAECPDNSVSRSALRRAARALVGRWVAGRASGLLAVSHFAVDYFRDLGFRDETIYPFGYFRRSVAVRRQPDSDLVNIIYIGQLIHRKGIDLLLKAMAPLWSSFPDVRLSLVGVGPDRASIVAKVRADGLANRVTLEGAQPASQIHELLANASVLILPSRWDGWGLVINEALAAGVPVIVSDRCGAADLVRHGINGYVFRSENVDCLRARLSAFLSSDRKQMRAAALRTGSTLTIPLTSDYFVECLEHMCGFRNSKPIPPWEEVLRVLESEFGGSQRGDDESMADVPTVEQKSA